MGNGHVTLKAAFHNSEVLSKKKTIGIHRHTQLHSSHAVGKMAERWAHFETEHKWMTIMGVTLTQIKAVATTPTFLKINISPMGVAWKE